MKNLAKTLSKVNTPKLSYVLNANISKIQSQSINQQLLANHYNFSSFINNSKFNFSETTNQAKQAPEKPAKTEEKPKEQKQSETQTTQTQASNNPERFKIPENDEEYVKLVEHYEVEYEKVYSKFLEEQLKAVGEVLTDTSKDTCDKLVDEVYSFSKPEKVLFGIFVKQHTLRVNRIDITKLRRNIPALRTKATKFWPPSNPDWDIIKITGGGRKGGSGAPTEAKEEKKEESKAPEVVSLLYLCLY